MLQVRFALVVVFGLAAGQALAASFAGPAHVVDGDTLDLSGVRVRLFGIDAPESRQRCDPAGRDWACGIWASRKMAALIGAAEVACVARDRDRYGRVVAICSVSGRDLGRAMVRAGAARAYLRYSRDYLPDENLAKSEARGLWSGPAQSPEAWRRSATATVSGAAAGATAACAIKGNVSAGGTRIYHLPGQRDYAATRITPSRGEAWFCSRAAAEAAGFRAARR